MPFDAPQRSNHDSELLAQAKNALVRRGWVQGQYSHDDGRLCAVAALAIACGNRRFGHPSRTQRRLARLLASELPHWGWYSWWMSGYFRVKGYNDAPHTGYDDVMDMYDRAIMRQDEKAWSLLVHSSVQRDPIL